MTEPHFPFETPPARDPVEELAEAFLERYRRGERPALSEFTARAPDHADEIRATLAPVGGSSEQEHATESHAQRSPPAPHERRAQASSQTEHGK